MSYDRALHLSGFLPSLNSAGIPPGELTLADINAQRLVWDDEPYNGETLAKAFQRSRKEYSVQP